MATKAEARRWLDARVGQRIDTVLVKGEHNYWRPGFRTLAKRGATNYTLDGSELPRLADTDTSVVQVDNDGLVLRTWAGTFTYSTLPVA